MRATLMAIAALSIAAAPLNAHQAGHSFQIPESEVRLFESVLLDFDFELHLAFPVDYDQTPGRQLPVLFLLDSNEDFPLATAIMRNLAESGEVPPMLVVGIGYPEYPLYYRSRDYTPTTDPDSDLPSGGATDFLEFIMHELLPYLEDELQVTRPYILAGHSLGGLFAIHAARTAPAVFDAVIASSPSAWWDDEVVIAEQPEPGGLPLTYTSLGGRETTKMTTSWQHLVALLEDTQPRGSHQSELVEGETHNSVKPIALSHGLVWLWSSLGGQ